MYPLLKTEIYVALSCLAAHGNFVLKVFTTFEQATVDLLHVLYRTFRQVIAAMLTRDLDHRRPVDIDVQANDQ